MSGSAESGGDDSMNDGRKGGGKRELSQSKRAAQNRAAQVRTTFVAAELAISRYVPILFEVGQVLVRWCSSCFVNSHVIHLSSLSLHNMTIN